jgi:hypothetical protein
MPPKMIAGLSQKVVHREQQGPEVSHFPNMEVPMTVTSVSCVCSIFYYVTGTIYMALSIIEIMRR